MVLDVIEAWSRLSSGP